MVNGKRHISFICGYDTYETASRAEILLKPDKTFQHINKLTQLQVNKDKQSKVH